MTRLSVNLNAVAMLRNRRNVGWPSVTNIARLVLDAGADGITVHPRPDERHIRRSDVFDLIDVLKDYPEAEFNIEGFPSDDFLTLVEAAQPDQVTFVPDDPDQSTSDHGWDIDASAELLSSAIARMKAAQIRVSLFIDEDPEAPVLAAAIAADRVEIFTGPYGASFPMAAGRAHLKAIVATSHAAELAAGDANDGAGIGVNIGHDLTLENLPALVAAMPRCDEASIGHGITADALLMGFPEAVRRYKAALET